MVNEEQYRLFQDMQRQRDVAEGRLNMAVSAMRAWEEQLSQDDGSFGTAEVRQAIRATLDAIAAR